MFIEKSGKSYIVFKQMEFDCLKSSVSIVSSNTVGILNFNWLIKITHYEFPAIHSIRIDNSIQIFWAKLQKKYVEYPIIVFCRVRKLYLAYFSLYVLNNGILFLQYRFKPNRAVEVDYECGCGFGNEANHTTSFGPWTWGRLIWRRWK